MAAVVGSLIGTAIGFGLLLLERRAQDRRMTTSVCPTCKGSGRL